MKYIAVVICPINIKGFSTCLAPNHIRVKKLITKTKKKILLNNLNCIPLDLPKSTKGRAKIINSALNIAITPNNLLGIDLNIA
jgi:hypothetical protein